MTIHEEASQAYREALADGCACWRCQDAGLRAVVRRIGELLTDALEADESTTLNHNGATTKLLEQMERRKDTT